MNIKLFGKTFNIGKDKGCNSMSSFPIIMDTCLAPGMMIEIDNLKDIKFIIPDNGDDTEEYW